MTLRRWTPLAALACFLVPPPALAQHAEHDDTEVIEKPAVPPRPARLPDVSQVAEQIIRRTNEFRARHGRKPVKPNARLTQAARDFAGYMARTDRYGHHADGSRPPDRAKKHGYEFCIILENIAYQHRSSGFTTRELADRFLQAWERSPAHRRNMLDAGVLDTGVGVARSKDTGYFYAVQLLGRPKSESIRFKVVNNSGADLEYRVGEQTFSLPARYTRAHQACRPPEVKFESPGAKPTTLRPHGGERYVVVKEGGALRVRKE